MVYVIAGLAAAAGFAGVSVVLFFWGLQATVDHIARSEQDDDET